MTELAEDRQKLRPRVRKYNDRNDVSLGKLNYFDLKYRTEANDRERERRETYFFG